MLLHQVGIGRLGIFHERAAADAVHIHRYIMPVKPGDTQSPQEGVGDLLALDAGVVPRAIAGLVNLVEGSRAQELIIIGENPLVMAEIAGGGVEALVIGAAGKTCLGIVNDTAATHDRAIVSLIAHVRELAPAIGVHLGDPEMVHGKTAAGIAIAKHDDALRHGRAVVEQDGETRRRQLGVSRGNIESHNRPRHLTWDSGAEDTIIGNGVAAGPLILHRHRGVRDGRINSVI